ncbi:hypothetical protein GCM10023208_34610 [Erythrobacter westpacificensis]|jgi:hypothetical protein|uniref:Uncharacterized protein n=1 Tax=Erythrobacter westpacificensis TaxID=1055231 RepID=A0ABP9KTP6_9SPHN
MDKGNDTKTAVSLMKMALALLDKAGEGTSAAACHLQAAIDAGSGAPKPLAQSEKVP